MATNLGIDESLLLESQRLGKHRTKKEAVNVALRSYVSYLKRLRSLSRFGTFEFDPVYDYKKERNR